MEEKILPYMNPLHKVWATPYLSSFGLDVDARAFMQESENGS